MALLSTLSRAISRPASTTSRVSSNILISNGNKSSRRANSSSRVLSQVKGAVGSSAASIEDSVVSSILQQQQTRTFITHTSGGVTLKSTTTTHITSSSQNYYSHRSPSFSFVNSKAFYTTCDICKRTIPSNKSDNNDTPNDQDSVSDRTVTNTGANITAINTSQLNAANNENPTATVKDVLENPHQYSMNPPVKKPKRIILMRHAQSLANVDKTIHTHTPDYKISLTRKGRMQANEAGKLLSSIIPKEESVKFWVSPYYRTRETFEQVAKSFTDHKEIYYYEEIRLREQEWGNFQDSEQIRQISQERWRYGPFYYRFPNGESGSDVYDRVSAFLETFHRHFGRQDNMVLISHGLTCRLFLMRWYKWSVKLFHRLQNLENAQCVIMELQPDGKYKITTPLILREGSEIGFPEDDFHPDILNKIHLKNKSLDDQISEYDEHDEMNRYRPFFVSKSPQTLGKLHYRVQVGYSDHHQVGGGLPRGVSSGSGHRKASD